MHIKWILIFIIELKCQITQIYDFGFAYSPSWRGTFQFPPKARFRMRIHDFDVIVGVCVQLLLHSIHFMTNPNKIALVPMLKFSNLLALSPELFTLLVHIHVKLRRANIQFNVSISLHKKWRKKPLGLFVHVARVVNVYQFFFRHQISFLHF